VVNLLETSSSWENQGGTQRKILQKHLAANDLSQFFRPQHCCKLQWVAQDCAHLSDVLYNDGK